MYFTFIFRKSFIQSNIFGWQFFVVFFFPRTLNMSSHFLLAFIVSDGIPLYMAWHFSLATFKVFIFGFQQFYCNVSICESLCLFYLNFCWEFCKLIKSLFYHDSVIPEEVFQWSFLPIFFSAFFSFSPCTDCTYVLNDVSYFWVAVIFFILFFLCCSDYIISINLSSICWFFLLPAKVYYCWAPLIVCFIHYTF